MEHPYRGHLVRACAEPSLAEPLSWTCAVYIFAPDASQQGGWSASPIEPPWRVSAAKTEDEAALKGIKEGDAKVDAICGEELVEVECYESYSDQHRRPVRGLDWATKATISAMRLGVPIPGTGQKVPRRLVIDGHYKP